jgi:NAD(P)-dependent dehydrogenase (short-subunit alcohol dehydrogenase family)
LVAGTSPLPRQPDRQLDDLVRVVDVNLMSVVDRCRPAAPLLLAAPAASVIMVASTYGGV